jgi:hypothetical protein
MNNFRKVRKGRRHPLYFFDTVHKRKVYDAVYQVLEPLGKLVRTLTLPYISNYKMEWELLERFPGVELHCFERNPNLYRRIRNTFTAVPPGTRWFNKDVTDYFRFLEGTPMAEEPYDLIFMDSCGEIDRNICSTVLPFLRTGGILALTQCIKFRMWKPYHVDLKNYSVAVSPYRYNGRMEFMALRKNGLTGRRILPVVIQPEGSEVSRWDMRRYFNDYDIDILRTLEHTWSVKETAKKLSSRCDTGITGAGVRYRLDRCQKVLSRRRGERAARLRCFLNWLMRRRMV